MQHIYVNMQHTCMYIDMQDNYVDMRLKLRVKIIILHVDINKSHVNIIMLHVDMLWFILQEEGGGGQK